MADIVIEGKTHEARVTSDGENFTYRCSVGAWCNRPPMVSGNMRDVIEDATIHVDLHDDEAANA